MRRKIAEYLAHLACQGYAAGTIRSYKVTLGLFERSGFAVGRFRARLSPRPHLARQRLSQVRYFLRFAGRKTEADAITLPRVPIPPPKRPPSRDEVKELLRRLDGTSALSLRDRAMAELIYSSGLRACEVARIRLADLDLGGRVVRVHGKGGRHRSVPFGAAAAEWLARYLAAGRPGLKAQGDALFVAATGRPLQVPGIRARLRPLTAHDLRRAAAAHCQAAGMNLREIQEFLGHADVKSTVRYTGFDREELRAVVERCHPRGKTPYAMRPPSRRPGDDAPPGA